MKNKPSTTNNVSVNIESFAAGALMLAASTGDPLPEVVAYLARMGLDEIESRADQRIEEEAPRPTLELPKDERSNAALDKLEAQAAELGVGTGLLALVALEHTTGEIEIGTLSVGTPSDCGEDSDGHKPEIPQRDRSTDRPLHCEAVYLPRWIVECLRDMCAVLEIRGGAAGFIETHLADGIENATNSRPVRTDGVIREMFDGWGIGKKQQADSLPHLVRIAGRALSAWEATGDRLVATDTGEAL